MTKKFYVLLVVLFGVLLIRLGSWGLTESSEARYAEIGREMALSNDFINPSLLGIIHYHKPPVTYAITAIGYKIFGYNEFGARFFLSLALILQLLLIFKIARLWFKDDKIALASALTYFSFPLALIAVRNLTTDAFLTTFIIWAIYLWLQNKLNEKITYLYLFYIVLGLACLTKGPVAFLPVALFILCYKIINREKPKVSIHSVLGLILLLGISASWFIILILQKPELWDYFIQEQIIDRSVHAETFHRDKPFWFYLVLVPALSLPWIVPTLITIFKVKQEKWDKPTQITGYTALSILIAFSLFSSKLILYILPMFPFLALFCGSVFIQYGNRFSKIYEFSFRGAFLLLVLIITSLFFIPQFTFTWYKTLLFLGISLAFGSHLLFRSKAAQVDRLLVLSTAMLSVLILIYADFAAQNQTLINSPKAKYAFVKSERTDRDYKVLVYDNLLSSAPFYLGDRVITIYNSNFEAKRDTRFETTDHWKETYLPLNEPGQSDRLKKLLADKNNVLLIKNKKSLPDSLQYLLQGFQAEKMKKWTVYY
ncbi:ArnT family glycosyltransferase [Leeuwenhoekiella parthenopeia]|uniref:Glycosyltransferase family 39 protein n=1 Tax=Leeuwenhoekiella parthenopeia TaxID=2890320 RepID=A0ABS8GPI7_9FLAO|nr:glycosyltransferase family 39 protein [Leeuwenhoekiella parthenopeia]MCC4211909.1 glycosyltransferase family 39 protein [Leeuwenhoekiella parthenopeia]